MPRLRPSVDCHFCSAQHTCLIREINDPATRKALVEQRTTLTLDAREPLYMYGDPADAIFIICSGIIKTYRMTESGKPLITRMAGRGEVLGLGSVFARTSHDDYAEATERAVVARIERRILERELHRDPAAMALLLNQLGRELARAEHQALAIAYQSAKERLLEKLWAIADRQTSNRIVLSRRDLAELTGLTIETTVRTLKQCEREGLLALRGRAIDLAATRPQAA